MTPTPEPIRALHRRRVGEPQLTGIYHYDFRRQRVEDAPGGVWGDLSAVRGDLSGVWGDLSGVWGDLSGVRGDLSDVRGDLDLCGLTDEMRAAGEDVSTLIVPDR